MMDVPKKPILVEDAGSGQTSGKKVLIVGDGDTGKTSLVSALVNEQFSNRHIPTEHVIKMSVKGILETYRVCDADGKKFERQICLYI